MLGDKQIKLYKEQLEKATQDTIDNIDIIDEYDKLRETQHKLTSDLNKYCCAYEVLRDDRQIELVTSGLSKRVLELRLSGSERFAVSWYLQLPMSISEYYNARVVELKKEIRGLKKRIKEEKEEREKRRNEAENKKFSFKSMFKRNKANTIIITGSNNGEHDGTYRIIEHSKKPRDVNYFKRP